MLKKLTALLVCPLCLTACQELAMHGYTGAQPDIVVTPTEVQEIKPRISPDDGRISQEYTGLKAWWSFFSDSVLNSMVSSALSMNAAELNKKEDFPEGDITNESLIKYYKDKRVDLVNAIAKDYIEYRYVQMQNSLLDEYISRQEVALQQAVGREEEKIKTELGFLRNKKEEFIKKLQDLSVSLSKTTQLLPEYIDEVLKNNQGIPDYDITPILASSAHTITNAADIDAERSILYYKTHGQIDLQETKDILLDIPLNRLFGISENIFVDPHSSWRVKIGYAREQTSFDPLKPYLSYKPQCQDFESSVNAFVTEIESIMVSTATLRDQQEVLEKAISTATQEDIYKARLAALRAKYEKTKTVIKLFERLSLY